ncbi:hypothetical protein CYMTET_11691 [Cymbomonas tetramitiformis]|uniref:EF-hand domain-containing protein n=1 Tax=Cymbomonas tetramitiformis TaxID=36881 RepID=A0AAE0GM12_9CHLO|nr:hypothetical protein CYMTET_54542 [Cymbomonas tetramitiformis]KAK3280467.1 hypothetical protein CYMTET_11691 [Cymbomonas tetramitiformis]
MFAFLFSRPPRAKLSEEFLSSHEVMALRYGDVTEDFNPKTETNILSRQDADTIFSGIDRDKDGHIEKHEVLEGLESPELQELIKDSDDWTLQTAFQEKKLEVLFKNVDRGDGSIAREEWNTFVDRVILDRVEYLQAKALVETRNYFGKGLEGDRYLKLCGLVDRVNCS